MPLALLGELWVSGYGPLDHSFQGAGQTGDHTGSDTAFQKGNGRICEASGKDHQKMIRVAITESVWLQIMSQNGN